MRVPKFLRRKPRPTGKVTVSAVLIKADGRRIDLGQVGKGTMFVVPEAKP